MKAKHVFVTLGVALTMGLGVVTGLAMHKEMQPAKADNTATLYFDVSSTTWWNNAGALTFAHCWDGGTSTTWPGAQMSLVAGSTTKYSVEVDSRNTKVIFNRVNPNNQSEIWNRTSKDGGTPINLPADYSVNNQWNLTADGSNYDDGNYCGNWTLYTPPATTYQVDVYVDGSKRGTETIPEGELPVDAVVFGKTFEGWFSNAECTGAEVTEITSDTTVYAKLTAIPTVTYSLDVSQVSSTFANKYLYAWEENGATNAGWPGAELEGSTFTVPNDAKIIITNGPGTTKQTVDITQSGVANDTLKILNDQDGETHYYYQWASEETITYSYSLNGGDYVDMQVNQENPNEVYADALELSKGDTLTFKRNSAALAVAAKDDDLLTNVFVNGDDELEFAVDYEGGIYLDTLTNKLWAGQFESGYYLYGSNTDWNVKLGVKAQQEGESQVYYVEDINLADNAEVKMIYIPNDSATITYYNADASKVSTNTEVEYSVTEEYHNLKVANGSSYDIYYNVESGWYSIEDNNWSEPVYTLKVGDGEPIEMTKGEGNEYYVSGIDLPGNAALSYAKNNITVEDSIAKVVSNNNMKSNKHVLATARNVDVYVDVVEKTIWAGGIPLGGQHIFKNYASDRQVIQLAHGDPFEGYDQYYSQMLSFEEGDTIEFINCGIDNSLPVVWHPGIINAGGLGDKFELVDNVITAKEDVPQVAVYLKTKSGLDEVYFGETPEYVDDALDFAEEFNTTIKAACELPLENDQRKTQLVSSWASMASKWAALSEESQNYLKTDKSNATVQAFNAKYDEVLRLRGAWGLANFMGKDNPTNTINQISPIVNNVLFITSIAISVLMLSAGITLFILKKRKVTK